MYTQSAGSDVKGYFSKEILDAAHEDIPSLKKHQLDVSAVFEPFLKVLIDSDMNVATLSMPVVQKKAEPIQDRKNLQGKVAN